MSTATPEPGRGDLIALDSKDWTWVLSRPCPECGLDTRAVRREQIAVRLRENAAAWPAVLARPDVRDRPDPGTWSPLEYGGHVRDVFVLYDSRLADRLDGVETDGWSRSGRRSDGASFTVETFARYLLHDPVHHLWDVEGKQSWPSS